MLTAPNSSVLAQPYLANSYTATGNYTIPLSGNPGTVIYAPNSTINISSCQPPAINCPQATPAADSFTSATPLVPPAVNPAYPPTANAYPPSIPPTSVVANNQHSTMWGDPHVTTASGGKYDFQQTGVYNLLSDKNINLNAKLQGSGEAGKPTFITEAGLTFGARRLDVKADGTAQLGNGPSAIVLQDGQTLKLADGSTISKQGKTITADTPEYTIKFDTGNPDQATTQHININIGSKANGVMSDGAAPTGILGESFNSGTQAQNAAALDTGTYQRGGLFDSNTNAATQALAAQNLINAGGQIVNPNQIPPTTPTGGTGGAGGITALLQMMAMMLQMMMQLLGQGSSNTAA